MTIALKCVHYWDIEAPHGETSKAKCRKCGREREYQNYKFPDYNNKPKDEIGD